MIYLHFIFSLSCTEQELPIPVRLADGSVASEGRVELFFKEQWGTVCDDNWNLNDANVVCNSLGYNGAVSAVTLAGFGQGAAGSPILLDETKCFGNETAIEQCNHRGFGTNNCAHAEDAGVTCQECTYFLLCLLNNIINIFSII